MIFFVYLLRVCMCTLDPLYRTDIGVFVFTCACVFVFYRYLYLYLLRVCMYTYVVGADPLERTGIGGSERNEGKFYSAFRHFTNSNTNTD